MTEGKKTRRKDKAGCILVYFCSFPFIWEWAFLIHSLVFFFIFKGALCFLCYN